MLLQPFGANDLRSTDRHSLWSNSTLLRGRCQHIFPLAASVPHLPPLALHYRHLAQIHTPLGVLPCTYHQVVERAPKKLGMEETPPIGPNLAKYHLQHFPNEMQRPVKQWL